MKNIIKNGIFALIIVLIAASCKKENMPEANLDLIDQNIIAKTSVDTWLGTNYLDPYNIEVKYKFDRFELPSGKVITPVLEGQVIPAMETVKEVWIRPFEIVGGDTFIKRISPKQFVLAGSAEYNSDGSITLGTAEGGRKIVLYVINNFDKTSLSEVKRMIQVIQHEYTHILNQTIDYQTDYQTISRGGYVGNWTLEPLEDAYTLGFITQYARSAPGEDFAETSSNMLMLGRVVFNSIVSSAAGEGKSRLQKKEQYVVEYFKSSFNIDFYALQEQVQTALDKISPPVLANMIGPRRGYTSMYSNPATQPNQSPEFLAAWNASRTAIAAQGFVLKDVKLDFPSLSTMTMTYSFTNAAGSTTYLATTDYTMTQAAGRITFARAAVQPTSTTYQNMGVIATSMAPVNGYFVSGPFAVNWINQLITGAVGRLGSLGAFYKVSNNNSYFYGTMSVN